MTAPQTWLCEGDPRNEQHVIPINDLIDHELTDDCVCGPTAEAVKRDDGSVGWLITHHSLDGREQHEENKS